MTYVISNKSRSYNFLKKGKIINFKEYLREKEIFFSLTGFELPVHLVYKHQPGEHLWSDVNEYHLDLIRVEIHDGLTPINYMEDNWMELIPPVEVYDKVKENVREYVNTHGLTNINIENTLLFNAALSLFDFPAYYLQDSFEIQFGRLLNLFIKNSSSGVLWELEAPPKEELVRKILREEFFTPACNIELEEMPENKEMAEYIRYSVIGWWVNIVNNLGIHPVGYTCHENAKIIDKITVYK